jgi:primosomal protein N' (replication factor Y)
LLVEIALKTTFNNSILTYDSGELELAIGQTVSIPLQKRYVQGTVVKLNIKKAEDDEIRYKQVKEILDEAISFSEQDLKWLSWIADYYHYPLGLLISEVKPKELKRPRAITYEAGENIPFEFDLSSHQNQIIEKLSKKLNQFHQALIHGVTGSGKTAIYIELMKKVISNGKSVLFLLPEINLTPQFLLTLKQYLNCNIYSYHSAISNSDKYTLWQMANDDTTEPFVVLGVRSSIFVPINNLGLIIVDEEHDPSFKQEERCPYNARDIAIKKSHMLNIPIIMGSATPNLETLYRLSTKTDQYFPITERVGPSTLPEIHVLSNNVENYSFNEIDCWPFLPESLSKIEQRLEKGEQVIVFVNRLGHANYLMCKSCGHQFVCPNCSTNLRYFRSRGQLSCNICDYKQKTENICPECGNMVLSPKGYGTELLENKLKEVFPSKVTRRLDRDEIKTINSLKERLNEFHEGEVDILVGTQMLSKGHNFKNVNLVVIMGLDGQLNYPDHRANERVFQLLKQVSGRSGRYGNDGEVIIQTYSAHHPIFDQIKQESTDQFYQQELSTRSATYTPPYQKIAALYLSTFPQILAIEESEKIKNFCEKLINKHYSDVECLGPRPSIIEKKKNLYTWTLLLKSTDLNQLHLLIDTLFKNIKLNSRSQLKIDVDPYTIY